MQVQICDTRCTLYITQQIGMYNWPELETSLDEDDHEKHIIDFLVIYI